MVLKYHKQGATMSASNYEQLSDHQKQVGQELVTVSAVKQGEKVLDLGCGTGHFAVILSELVGPEGKIVAIDPDVERIKLAKEKLNARANIEYLVENDQTFPGDNYDLVFSNHVIHWIKDKEALFKRLYEKMSSGGRFAFLTFSQAPDYPPVIIELFSKLVSPDFVPNLLQRTSFEDSSRYRLLAESVGFEVTTVEQKQCISKWASLDNFIQYFHGVSHGGFDLSSLDKDAVQSFREKHEEELLSQKLARHVLYIVVTKQ